MIGSRVWYAIISATVGVLLLAMSLVFERTADAAQNFRSAELTRDRVQAEMLWRLDDAKRHDALAPLSADSRTVQLIKQANSGRSSLENLSADISRRLKELSADRLDVENDFLLAINARGEPLTHVGRKPKLGASGWATFAAVKRALQGYVADNVLVLDREVYRVSVWPITESGQYIGALGYGSAVDTKFTKEFAEKLAGASVGFFQGERLLASYVPPSKEGVPELTEIENRWKTLQTDKEFTSKGVTAPLGLEHSRAIFANLPGDATQTAAGYVIARPMLAADTLTSFIESATSRQVASLPWVLVILAFGFLFGAGWFVLWAEHDRPIQEVLLSLERAKKDPSIQLDPSHFRGRFRLLVQSFEEFLEERAKITSAQNPSSQQIDLNKILGPSLEKPKASSYFSFASNPPAAAQDIPSLIPLPLKPPAPPIAKETSSVPLNPQSVKSMDDTVRDLPFGRAPQKQVLADDAPANEEAHHREVFQHYIAAHKQCGLSTDGMTFEKFVVTLEKTRDDIVTRRGVRTVRFTVYVKEGRPTLKATPIRDKQTGG